MPTEASESEGNESEQDDSNRLPLSRRNVIRAGAFVVTGSAAGASALYLGTGSAMALTGATLAVNSATLTTDDGTISNIDLQDEATDDNAGLDLDWEGFEGAAETVTFTLEARLDVDEDEDGEASYEQLLSGTYTLSGTTGSVSLDWMDAFGESVVSLFDHTAIDATDFEAADDGTTRARTLHVRLTATAESATATSEASNTLTVDNLAADSSTGGTVDTSIQE